MNDNRLNPRYSRLPASRGWGWFLVFGIAAVLLFTLNLGVVPLRDWDEGTVAQVAKEIWQASPGSQTWLYPTLWGEPYLNKPPLVHWLIAMTYDGLGVNEWSARLPGALLTALSVPLLYGLGRELWGCQTPAIFATIVYLTLLPVVRHGRLAMLDGAALCFWVLMVWFLLWSRRDLRACLGVGLSLGFIFLTKGLLGVLLGAIALSFLAWDTPRLLTTPFLWLGLGLGCLPAGLWFAAQWHHYGQMFVETSVLSQSLDRIWTTVGNNSGPPWYYLLEILKYSWPWLLFLPAALVQVWENRVLGWAKLLLVWSGGYLLAISLMSTKLPWYVMPLYPALALIVGVKLADIWQHPHPWQSQPYTPIAYPRLWTLGLGLLALGGWGLTIYYSHFAPPPNGALLPTMIAVGFTMTIALFLLQQRDAQFVLVLAWGMYVTIGLLILSGHWLWELNEDYPIKPVAAIVAQQVPPGTPVYTSHPIRRPSLEFYAGHPVIPQADGDLQRRWQHTPAPYFLLDGVTVQRLDLPEIQSLGQAEGWHLVTRSRRVRSEE
ncbi:ArnT family glycosyltransferase [Trichothermofontia sp.]